MVKDFTERGYRDINTTPIPHHIFFSRGITCPPPVVYLLLSHSKAMNFGLVGIVSGAVVQ
jgi:hypothetical protein